MTDKWDWISRPGMARPLRRSAKLTRCIVPPSPSLWPSLAGPSYAQEAPFWPGARYDPAIPTVRQVLGHEPGEEITPPEQVGQYLQALQKAAPTRTRLVEYARTWEGRPLWLFVIGSAERIGALDAVKADMKRLADPRGVERRRAARLVKELAGGRLARSRCPRQRDLVVRRRACSRPITCWPRRATLASTRCCATRWC